MRAFNWAVLSNIAAFARRTLWCARHNVNIVDLSKSSMLGLHTSSEINAKAACESVPNFDPGSGHRRSLTNKLFVRKTWGQD
jgi:hypothetical protein